MYHNLTPLSNYNPNPFLRRHPTLTHMLSKTRQRAIRWCGAQQQLGTCTTQILADVETVERRTPAEVGAQGARADTVGPGLTVPGSISDALAGGVPAGPAPGAECVGPGYQHPGHVARDGRPGARQSDTAYRRVELQPATAG